MKNLISLFLILFTISIAKAQSGSLDSTFGNNGIVTEPDSIISIEDIAIQPDGKIVVGGARTTNYPWLVLSVLIRYNPDGSHDNSFGNNGIQTIFQNDSKYIESIAIQPDGKIICGGGVNAGSQEQFMLMRCFPNGSLDSSFSNDGVVVTEFGQYDEVLSHVLLQPDGKIVASGTYQDLSSSDFVVIRYNQDGSMDSSFGSNGIAAINIGQYGISNDALLDADGNILLGGESDGTITFDDLTIVKYNSVGSLDNTFGIGGYVQTDIDSETDWIWGMSFDQEGKILAAGKTGFSNVGTGEDFAMARYNPDGSLDPLFGNQGTVTTDIGFDDEGARAVEVQPDGKIILGGTSGNIAANIYQFTLIKYKTNGTVDSSFGMNGVVTTTIDSATNVARSMALQQDGKILLGGFIGTYPENHGALIRYNDYDTNVGLETLKGDAAKAKVLPNPLRHIAEVQYTLNKESTVSIVLQDLKGQVIHHFIDNAFRTNGVNSETLHFPDAITAGIYILKIQSAIESINLKLVIE